MKEVFEKIINFVHSEIARTTSYAEHDTLINVKFFVEELEEKYKHCALCYLGSPCEYQNENATLQNELLADNNGWILCSDRLPECPKDDEDKKSYLVTVKRKNDGFTFTNKIFFYPFGWNVPSTCEVLAWQPLPEPYKECER